VNATTAVVIVLVVLALVFVYYRYTESQRLLIANSPGNRIGGGLGMLAGGIIDVAVS